jgi:hypothetical protein
MFCVVAVQSSSCKGELVTSATLGLLVASKRYYILGWQAVLSCWRHDLHKRPKLIASTCVTSSYLSLQPRGDQWSQRARTAVSCSPKSADSSTSGQAPNHSMVTVLI